MITYKVLVRSLFDYAPMAHLLLSDTNLSKLEKVQRKAIRMVTLWLERTKANEIYAKITPKFKIEPVINRIIKLTDNNILKAHKHNEAIKQLVYNYNLATQVNEGALLRPKFKPRLTILGTLKQNETTQSKNILTEATYPEISLEQYNSKDPDDLENPLGSYGTPAHSHTTAYTSPYIPLTTIHLNNSKTIKKTTHL